MYSNTDQLIAQVRADLSKLSDAGLLDETSMYRDIHLGLKRFGNDIMILQETVIEVKGGKAELPEGFFSLYAAYLCEPLGYTHKKVDEAHDLQSSHFYRERIVESNRWNECEACCDDKSTNIIRENLYFKSNIVEFTYNNPTLLRLGKTFKKNQCHSKCRNKFVKDNPNEIVIIGNTLQANFSEGSIYFMYYGLPTDEDGNIDIPHTPNGHLETYLEYYLKRRIIEGLLLNSDAPAGLPQMLTYVKQEEQVALRNASNELKMRNLANFSRRWVRLNRLEALQFESALINS
jgi:hypothetical protein